jgi:2-oxoglutarate dehydrogenase E1 component
MTAISSKNGKTRERSSNAVLEATSFLSGNNAAFIEPLYEQFRADPASVDGTWRAFFEALQEGRQVELPGIPARNGAETRIAPAARTGADAQASIRAVQLVRAYRQLGHREADLDPLKLSTPKPLPQLQVSFYGFHGSDLDRPIFVDGTMGRETVTPRELVEVLRST